MATAIILLIVVTALVTLSIMRPSSPFPGPALGSGDRDRDRQLDELRALRDYRSDVRLR